MRTRSFCDVPEARLASQPSKCHEPSLRNPPARWAAFVLACGLICTLAACSGSATSTRDLPTDVSGPVRGFQIQIHTTDEKATAENVVAEAQTWWASLDEQEKRRLYGSTSMPVEVKWLQPYYRVRMGHFRSREEARGLLSQVAGQFPAAFIVPDTLE